jgi:hypothetical protein
MKDKNQDFSENCIFFNLDFSLDQDCKLNINQEVSERCSITRCRARGAALRAFALRKIEPASGETLSRQCNIKPLGVPSGELPLSGGTPPGEGSFSLVVEV